MAGRPKGGGFGVFSLLVCLWSTSAANPTDSIDYSRIRGEELREVLKPIPVRTPREALETLEVLPGLRVELAAYEPLVVDPVAGCFDEEGALYVCELSDYPYRPEEGQEPLGKVRLLRDQDDDGLYETSTVFADRLLWPAGVAPWKGGVFVAAPPDIWYMKDESGDGVADLREKVFTGFGEHGAQYILNNLKWGLDHRIYASVAGNGGEVVPFDDPDATPIPVRGVDFRFDPSSGKGDPTSGNEQFGNTFDDWGNRFLCSQDSFLYQVVYPLRAFERNPLLASPDTQTRLSPSGDPIFRTSPVEAWRAIRSSRRILSGKGQPERSGVSHHVSDGVAGTTVYNGDALPLSFYGNTFSGDAQNNLVHRRSLTREGVLFRSERLDPETEFLRTDDNWFRPVNFLTAPDGSLYVFDLCREILEAVHIPMDVVEHLDLTNGRNQGRIYRIVREDWKRPGPPRLSSASTAELVELLEHPNGWRRETAHRLLFERQAAEAVPLLREILTGSEVPQARLLALYALKGLSQLGVEDLLLSLHDHHPAIREHSILLSIDFIEMDAEIREALLSMTDDADDRVRFQMALILGDFPSGSGAERGLATLAKSDGADPHIRTALLSSSHSLALQVLDLLLEDHDLPNRSEMQPIVSELARFSGCLHSPQEIASFLDRRFSESSPDSLLLGLMAGLGLAGRGFEAVLPHLSEATGQSLTKRFDGVRAILNDSDAGADMKERAVRLLALGTWEQAAGPLSDLFDSHPPEPVQVAAVEMLAGLKSDDAMLFLFDRWKSAAPGARRALLGKAVSREESIALLIDRLEEGRILPTEIDASTRSRLTQHPNKELAERAAALLAASGSRDEALEAFDPAIEIPGDAGEGAEIFELLCSSCHLLNEVGRNLGPNLALSSSRSKEELLIHIIDPNREVDPRYIQYHATTHDGELVSGIFVSESAASVTLANQDEEVSLSRDEIDSLQSSGLSIMPEGLEEGLDADQMASLLRFLIESQYDLGTSGQSFSTDQPETD